jgi:hypothetical protein
MGGSDDGYAHTSVDISHGHKLGHGRSKGLDFDSTGTSICLPELPKCVRTVLYLESTLYVVLLL